MGVSALILQKLFQIVETKVSMQRIAWQLALPAILLLAAVLRLWGLV